MVISLCLLLLLPIRNHHHHYAHALSAEPVRQNSKKRSFQEQDFPIEAYYIDPLPTTGTADDDGRAVRLVRERSYARQDAFTVLQDLPNLQDLSSPPNSENFLRFRVLAPLSILVGSFLAFAPLTAMIADSTPAIDQMQSSLSENDFVPGISIVYGTYLSLTLSMLYARQQRLTELCAKESAKLLQLTRRVFHLFRSDQEKRLSAAEYIADQVRILVKASRGRELMKVIYSDPYEGIDTLLNEYRDDMVIGDNNNAQRSLLNECTDTVTAIVLVRSERLSSESTFLPPAHFVVARVLAAMIILGYVVGTVPIVDENGQVPLASSAFFSVLVSVYFFFSMIAWDLGNPFSGVSQIRRSGIASNLLAVKWILQRDPLLLANEINFEGEIGHPICWEEDTSLMENLKRSDTKED